jgi:flagellin-like hook-associated protein FlgL
LCSEAFSAHRLRALTPVLERVTNIMSSRVSLATLTRTSSALFGVQQQISTGRSINRGSENVAKAATIGVLDDRLLRSEQLLRNFQHADSALSELDSTLVSANDLALQAKSLASSQLGATSSSSERASQARVVDSLLAGLFNSANRQGAAGYVLGGSDTSRAPISLMLGGYRFSGTRDGLITDLGEDASIPVTLGSANPIADGTARITGVIDLNPRLTASTRIAELTSARGQGAGVRLGTIEFSHNGSPRVEIDLTGSDTIDDVRARIEGALRRFEQTAGITVLGPGGVSLGDSGLTFDVTNPADAIQFFDIGTGVTAQDLGVATTPPAAFTSANPTGGDLQPAVSWRTPISALAGVTGPLGSIKLSNGGRSVTIDLSTAQTMRDIANLIDGSGLGVRTELTSDGIAVVNELASKSSDSLSIGEVNGGDTATRLGIRSLSGQTRLSTFNFGKGVQIVDGVNNPSTGTLDPALNSDFEVVLGDTAGSRIRIDLRPQDIVSVDTLLTRLNSEFTTQLAAAGLPAGSLTAGLAADGNGLTITQSPTFAQPLRIEPRNNSRAAEQLGLLNAAYTAGTLVSEDRAKVRTESLFTHLLDLRHALETNNTFGITLAGEGVEATLADIAELRGVVGGYAQRIDSLTSRENDRAVLDETVRSTLRDTDITQAATRLSLLQTQLEAGLRTTASLSQRSLLDFLG